MSKVNKLILVTVVFYVKIKLIYNDNNKTQCKNGRVLTVKSLF